MCKGTQMNSNTLRSVGENFKKFILTCLCCTKYDEINMTHSDVKRIFAIKNVFDNLNFFYRVAQKIMDILCAMAKNSWKSIFN